ALHALRANARKQALVRRCEEMRRAEAPFRRAGGLTIYPDIAAETVQHCRGEEKSGGGGRAARLTSASRPVRTAPERRWTAAAPVSRVVSRHPARAHPPSWPQTFPRVRCVTIPASAWG